MLQGAHARVLTTLIVLLIAGCGSEAGGPDDPGGGGGGGPGPEEAALIEVPDVIGSDAETAAGTIEGEGLVPDYDDGEPDDPALCEVTDQTPVSGDEVEDDEIVTMTVDCQVEVPELIGQPAADAVTDLEDLGLEGVYATDPADESSCEVSEQDFEAGEAVAEGETITLTVECQVPDMTGTDAESAASELETAGFEWSYDFEPDDPYECTVDSQDVEGLAPPGETVSLALTCEDGY